MKEIKSVYATNNQGCDLIKVGSNVGDTIIAVIRDETFEYENGITFRFSAYDKSDRLLKTFINGNLSITYKEDKRMANMSYCRFENTLRDLTDCYDALNENCITEILENASEYEKPCVKRLILLCTEIAEDWKGELES